MKIRLCIVNPYEHGGGAEYQIGLLIDALAATGRYDVHYLAHFLDERGRARNYSVARIGGGGPIPRLGYMAEAASLYRTLRDLDPAVIYQRVACGYTGICAAYARRRSVPLLWHAAHDTDVQPRLLDPGRNFLRVRLEKSAADFGVRRASAIVVQTRHQAQLLQQHYSRVADAIVPNFHPPAAETIDKSGPLTVVWIANLKPWKQPEVFVRLAHALRDQPAVHFVMVGAPAPAAGNRAWRDALHRDMQSADNLEYLGRKSQDEVNALLARAHIFVNTSTHEGFPNTFIQAWLRDAVVVSLSVDPDHVLERQQVGIAARTEQALIGAVRDLIAAPAARAAYADRARRHAQQHHSLRNAQDLVALIDQFQSASRGRGAAS